MHRSIQIGLLLLVLFSACHNTTRPIQNKQKADCLSVGPMSNTALQVKPFTWEGKHIYVVPKFWATDSLRAYCDKKTVSENGICHLLDTNIQIIHSQLPSLFINMKDEDQELIFRDKNQSVYASIALFLPDGTSEYEGEISIKTRGNSTWKEEEKKPFTIKLNHSAKLLGLERGKSFSLLSNTRDESLIRNAIAFYMSKKIGIFAPDFTYVSLYLNGNYLGIYQMTNKIEVNKRSVNIVDLEKENKQANDRPLKEYPTFSIGEPGMNGHKKGVRINNPDDITGGYRLDNTGVKQLYEPCISGFVSHAGDPVRIKSPKHASFEQVEYISDFYDKMEAAVMDLEGYHPVTGKYYTDYLDIQSFARYFLIQEITENLDGGWCSFMMYKDSGDSSKMVAGPAWDFDNALRKDYDPKYSFNMLWTNAKTTLKNDTYSGGLLYWLWQHEDFQRLSKQIFFEELHRIVNDSVEWQAFADSLVTLLRNDVEYNRMRFPTPYEYDYQEAAATVTDFVKERDAFLYWLWSADSCDIVRIPIKGCLNPRRDYIETETILLGNKTDGVTLPNINWRMYFYNDPTFIGYFICGTDSLVEEGTTFHHDQCIEIRWEYPTRFEKLRRRISMKLWRMFN